MTTLPLRIICPTPGKISAAILDQDEHWVDKHGFVHVLSTMQTSHLEHLEPFLLRKGEGLRFRWTLWQCAYFGQGDHGGNLDGAFDDFIDYEESRPLAEWLAARLLVIKVNKILDERRGR